MTRWTVSKQLSLATGSKHASPSRGCRAVRGGLLGSTCPAAGVVGAVTCGSPAQWKHFRSLHCPLALRETWVPEQLCPSPLSLVRPPATMAQRAAGCRSSVVRWCWFLRAFCADFKADVSSEVR